MIFLQLQTCAPNECAVIYSAHNGCALVVFGPSSIVSRFSIKFSIQVVAVRRMPSASAKLEKQVSLEAMEPLKQVLIFIEHKKRNLEKRKV
jgi:hypothetical protein